MTLQYSSLSNPPSVLNVSQPSGGIYSNTLSDPNTNSLNIHTSKIQSVGGSRNRRSRKNRNRASKRGGSRYRRSSRRRFQLSRRRSRFQ